MGTRLIDNPNYNIRLKSEKTRFKRFLETVLENTILLFWLGLQVCLLDLLLKNLTISCFIILGWNLIHWQTKAKSTINSIILAQQKFYEVKIELNYEALVKHPAYEKYWASFQSLDDKTRQEAWKHPKGSTKPFHFLVTYNFVWSEHLKKEDSKGFMRSWNSELVGGRWIHGNYLYENKMLSAPEPFIHFYAANGCINFKIDTYKEVNKRFEDYGLDSTSSFGEFPIAVMIPYLINRVETQDTDYFDADKEERQTIKLKNDKARDLFVKNIKEFYELDKIQNSMERHRKEIEIISKFGFNHDEDLDAEFGNFSVFSNGIVKVKIKEWDKVAF